MQLASSAAEAEELTGTLSVGACLLDCEGGKLRTMLADCFFKMRERFCFIEQGRITSWKRQKLNCNTIAVSPEANAVEGRWGGHNVSGAAVAEALATVSVEGLKTQIGAM